MEFQGSRHLFPNREYLNWVQNEWILQWLNCAEYGVPSSCQCLFLKYSYLFNYQLIKGVISNHLIQKKDEIINTINEKLEKYPEIKKVYVDFFCFPFNNIDTFRNGMYFNIHKVAYTK